MRQLEKGRGNPGSNPGGAAYFMKKDYLDISKASDIKNKKERRIYRFFEMLPGLLSIGTLIWVLAFSWLKPAWIAIFIILFCFYYLFRIFYLSLHQITSYLKTKKYLKTNWLFKLKNLKSKNWQNIYHLITLPTYKEGKEIIVESLESLVNADYPKEKMIVVLATEERAGKEGQKIAKELKEKYEENFFKFLVTVHPKNILGEIAGKGSNVAWAVRKAKEKIIDPSHISYKDVIVSNFDIDTKVYPQFFGCLAWHYLTVDNPRRTSYQPVPVYNNNIWSAPAFSRVVATSNTFWQMMQQERVEKLTTYSSHAMPLESFLNVGYPANVVSDDSRIFWKAYLRYDGDYRAVPLYYPVSMDAVMADNFLKTVINQYKQQRRWAWGCNEIPYLIYGFIKNKKISLWEKLSHIYTVIDGFWSWATVALLIFCLGWLPLVLGGEKFNYTILSYNLPRLTSRIMTAALIGIIISAILSMLLLPPCPKGVSKFKKLSVLLQWLLLPFTLIIFGSFPAIDAQIRLMLGKYMGFWVTEKVRRSDLH